MSIEAAPRPRRAAAEEEGTGRGTTDRTDRTGRLHDPDRDRYLDVLQATALAALVLLHLFDWYWLPLLFPSIGVLSASAGSRVATLLDRSSSTRQALARGLQRLLPPLWMLGLVLVPVMLSTGWTATTDGAQPIGPTLASWVIPVTAPPGSDLGHDWTWPLWYLSTYLWLLLLSPALLWLWRHWPRTLYLLPFLGLLLVSGRFVDLDTEVGNAVLSALVFAPCWMIGFAHHDSRLRAARLPRLVLVGALLCAAGVAWALRYPVPGEPAPDIADIPLADALFSLGFGMVLLRLPLSLAWIERVPVLRGFLDVVARRVLTVYLWAPVSVFAARELLDRAGIRDLLPGPGWQPWASLAAASLVLLLVLLAVGWVEDLALRCRPSLLPSAGRARLLLRSGRVESAAPRRSVGTTEDGTG